MSACDRGSKAAWKSHTFIALQEGKGIRVRSTVEVGVVCGSYSHSSQAEEEKGEPSVHIKEFWEFSHKQGCTIRAKRYYCDNPDNLVLSQYDIHYDKLHMCREPCTHFFSHLQLG